MNKLVFVNSFCWAYLTISGEVLWLIGWVGIDMKHWKRFYIVFGSLWVIIEIYLGVLLFETCREITKFIAKG